jgi:CheY-like chemotaxis protein
MTKTSAIPDLEDFTILIAEDDIFSYQMMEYMLEDTKARLIHADTGLKAQRILAENKIDFVFLDIRLPDKNGYQVLKHIREKYNGIPVIAQTANALPKDILKLQKTGFNSYITKPFTQEDLYQVLNEFVPGFKSFSYEAE